MATSIETNRDLECPVCQEPFRTPKILSCGHTICLDPCLEQLGKGKTSVICPECREVHDIPTGGVQKFPNNIFIIRLIDAEKKKQTDPSMGTCSVCQQEQYLLNCLHCSCLVCEDCRDAHTLEMRTDTRASLEQILGRVTEEEEAFHGDVKRRLESKIKTMEDTLDTAFSLASSALQSQKDHLKKEIKKYSRDQEQIIDEHKQHLAQIKKLCETDIDDATKQSSMLKMTKQIEKSEEAASRCKEDLAHVDQVQLDISDTALISSISGFGKLIQATDTTKSPPPDVRPKVVQPQVPRPRPSLRDRLSEIGPVKKCVGRPGSEPGQLMKPTALAVSPVTGNIIVADSGNYRLQVFDSNGEYIRSITCTVGEAKRFGNVKHLLVYKEGEICTLDGDLVLIHSESGEHMNMSNVMKIPNIASFAIDDKYRLHVCKGTDGVFVYDLDISGSGRNLSSSDQQNALPEVCVHDVNDTSSGGKVIRYGQVKGVDINAERVIIGDVISVVNYTYIRDHYHCTCRYRFYNFNLNYQFLGEKIFTLRKGVNGHLRYKIEKELILLVTYTKVCIMDSTFKLLKEFGESGHTIKQLNNPRDVAVTLSGDVVVVTDNFLQFF